MCAQGCVEAKVSALAVNDDDARTNPFDELIVGSLRRCVVCHPTRNPLFGELVERCGRELAVGERSGICWIGVVRSGGPKTEQLPRLFFGAEDWFALEELGIARPRCPAALDSVRHVHVITA